MKDIKEILNRIKNFEIKTNTLVEGLISGNYRSVFRGTGIEFSEVREYVPGDDIRAIDWNVTARFNSPFVKEFIEERDLNIYIVFDVSASNDFGYQKSKKELGYEIASSIMFSALKNNDNIGLCLFTDHVEKFIKPRKGKKFVLRLLRELVYYRPQSQKTDINNSLIYLSKIIKKRSIIFILSDFISDNFEKPIKFLKNKHDIILINLFDVNEVNIPDVGYIFLEDQENEEQILINTSDEDFKKLYTERIRKANSYLISKMKRLKVDMIQINTTEPFHLPLRRFFTLRKKRLGR